MANKRILKKTINNICDDLIAEIIATSFYSGQQEAEQGNSLLAAVIALHDNYVSRISHPEPGMKPKAYFKDLAEKFNQETFELIDRIYNIEQA